MNLHLITERIPDKGKDIIGLDKKGNKYYCFRCSCYNQNCMEWRCSTTGYSLMIQLDKWQYI